MEVLVLIGIVVALAAWANQPPGRGRRRRRR
jgi:hypothetical protein